MTRRILSHLLIVGCATLSFAAPPLSIPVAKPPPEVLVALQQEYEEEQRLLAIEKAREAAEAATNAAEQSGAAFDSDSSAEPTSETAAPTVAPASVAEDRGHAPSGAALEAPSPIASNPSIPADETEAGTIVSETEDLPAEPVSAVFRRDPFWIPVLAKSRRAEHERVQEEAAKAAAKEEAKRVAREEAIARGEDPDSIPDDAEDGNASAPASMIPPKDQGPAPDPAWEAAFAKVPPRLGILGGAKPALMLKGDRTPHHLGDILCVTNKGVVYTWRIAELDFRKYTHRFEPVSATPVPSDL